VVVLWRVHPRRYGPHRHQVGSERREQVADPLVAAPSPRAYRPCGLRGGHIRLGRHDVGPCQPRTRASKEDALQPIPGEARLAEHWGRPESRTVGCGREVVRQTGHGLSKTAGGTNLTQHGFRGGRSHLQTSLRSRNPCQQGRYQGIRLKSAISARLQLEKLPNASDLRENSLSGEQRPFTSHQGV
jgi:hypothetical protein